MDELKPMTMIEKSCRIIQMIDDTLELVRGMQRWVLEDQASAHQPNSSATVKTEAMTKTTMGITSKTDTKSTGEPVIKTTTEVTKKTITKVMTETTTKTTPVSASKAATEATTTATLTAGKPWAGGDTLNAQSSHTKGSEFGTLTSFGTVQYRDGYERPLNAKVVRVLQDVAYSASQTTISDPYSYRRLPLRSRERDICSPSGKVMSGEMTDRASKHRSHYLGKMSPKRSDKSGSRKQRSDSARSSVLRNTLIRKNKRESKTPKSGTAIKTAASDNEKKTGEQKFEDFLMERFGFSFSEDSPNFAVGGTSRIGCGDGPAVSETVSEKGDGNERCPRIPNRNRRNRSFHEHTIHLPSILYSHVSQKVETFINNCEFSKGMGHENRSTGDRLRQQEVIHLPPIAQARFVHQV